MKLELNLNQHQTSKQESKINIKQPKRKANQAKRTYKQEAVPKHQTNKQLANKQRTNNNSKQNGKQYENKQIKVKAICQTPICWGGGGGWGGKGKVSYSAMVQHINMLRRFLLHRMLD